MHPKTARGLEYPIPGNLLDGLARSREHPDTFHVPSEPEIAQIEVGNHIKIGLELTDGSAERFWVCLAQIDEHEGETRFAGTVANDLLYFPQYPDGSPIAVRARHILGILPT